jgi:hypothetical protein
MSVIWVIAERDDIPQALIVLGKHERPPKQNRKSEHN